MYKIQARLIHEQTYFIHTLIHKKSFSVKFQIVKEGTTSITLVVFRYLKYGYYDILAVYKCFCYPDQYQNFKLFNKTCDPPSPTSTVLNVAALTNIKTFTSSINHVIPPPQHLHL